MSEFNRSKNYESFQIPRREDKLGREYKSSEHKNSEHKGLKDIQLSLNLEEKDENTYYEIEYGGTNLKGVGKFVLKPQPIEKQVKDEKRLLFDKMRKLGTAGPVNCQNTGFIHPLMQQVSSNIFYKQGIFMKDFNDDYEGYREFNQYFPTYQMMGYEQLRTYFTWRTKVRSGVVEDCSLSYGFLYIYELLNNIGVESPKEGLDKLMFFWKAFKVYQPSIDKYMRKWVKDYHVYYPLEEGFRNFIKKEGLEDDYPMFVEEENTFELYSEISKYKIKKSKFYLENMKLVTDGFSYVLEILMDKCKEKKFYLEEELFKPSKKMKDWKPFREGLFHSSLYQKDRKVILSSDEIYFCKDNRWFVHSKISSDGGAAIIGYVMKQMEAVLRVLLNYKYKLTAYTDAIPIVTMVWLKNAEINLEKIISDAVKEFYVDYTKTIVQVDLKELSRIRKEAIITQEKLVVEEEKKEALSYNQFNQREPIVMDSKTLCKEVKEPLLDIKKGKVEVHITNIEEELVKNEWVQLKNNLTKEEVEGLRIILEGKDLYQYVNSIGLMLEVFVDGINEKSLDLIGDNLMDEEFVIYEDYIEQVKEWIV